MSTKTEVASQSDCSLADLLSTGSTAEKRVAVHALLVSLLGDRVEEECGIYDENDGLYACLLPPGKREDLRLLEDSNYAARLEAAARESSDGDVVRRN